MIIIIPFYLPKKGDNKMELEKERELNGFMRLGEMNAEMHLSIHYRATDIEEVYDVFKYNFGIDPTNADIKEQQSLYDAVYTVVSPQLNIEITISVPKRNLTELDLNRVKSAPTYLI